MKDTIYTIPISEVFEPKCGCPLCTLDKALHERWVDYITGAAMMEPDVRIETNRHGFCSKHFDMMLNGSASRLSLALILQTRLQWIDESFDKPYAGRGSHARPDNSERGRRRGGKGHPGGGDCFVCLKIGNEVKRIASNIVTVWSRESDFRELYAEQEFMCYNHARLLLSAAHEILKKESLAAFREATANLTRKKLRAIKADIDAFCDLFDYRNAGASHPGKAVATSVERSIAFLTSEYTEEVDQGDDSESTKC